MIASWLAWFFDAASFSPRSMCGAGWTDDLIRLSLSANAVVWLSYWSIAWQFARFWGRVKGRVGEAWIILAIAAFVAACGTTHLDDVLVFSWPAYRYFVANEVLTAALSACTALALPNVLRYLAGLPSSEELQAALAEKVAALAEADKARHGQDVAYRSLEFRRIEDANLAMFYRTKLSILEGNLSRSMDHMDRIGSIEDVRAMLALLGPDDTAPDAAPAAPTAVSAAPDEPAAAGEGDGHA